MDRAGVKRPRTGTPEGSSKKKDKNKKKKKSKLNPKNSKPTESNDDSNNNNASNNTNSLDTTATADGQYMAKILSTFSKMEQSRFEAFKRVSFPCNAISQYVAQCLAERQQQQRNPADHSSHFFSASSSVPQLHDLVVPGQEEEITTVVTTLAKAYAQRLCAAAKAQAQASAKAGDNSSSAAPIKPEHVLQAFYARKEQGQDPGFFLQPNESIMIAPNDGKEQMKRVAALAAQEDLDKSLEEYKALLDKEEAAGPAPIVEDSDSGDDSEIEMDMETELVQEMTGTTQVKIKDK